MRGGGGGDRKSALVRQQGLITKVSLKVTRLEVMAPGRRTENIRNKIQSLVELRGQKVSKPEFGVKLDTHKVKAK